MKKNEWSWLPNVLTGINLFLGFWSIVQVLQGNYLSACWLIVIASICDGLDGKLARFMKSSSNLGVELDSLADIVSFGVATGILLYFTSFYKYGFAGLVLASFPPIFGAIRLARYNRQAVTGEQKMFVGLPIPMQAITIATFIVFNQAIWGNLQLEIALIPMTIFVAFLMASHIPYEKMPRITFWDTKKNLLKLILILAGILLIAIKPPLIFFPLVMAYVLQGVFRALLSHSAGEEELETVYSELDDETLA